MELPVHLSSSESRALSDVMRLLADATSADALRQDLALPMLDLLGADTYVSFDWDSALQRFERVQALNMSLDSLRRWDDYFRFIDPLTLPMMKRRRPTVATQVVKQSELAATEFFNDFLTPERMHWGVNVYFFSGNVCVGDMRIWRQRARGNFECHELDLLRLVEPALAAGLGRLRWQADSQPRFEQSLSAQELLQRHSRLSQREAEVAWLVAKGCPDKLIATRLAMGYPTVRFHLANAFRKMQTENRALLAARVQSLVDSHQGERTTCKASVSSVV